jgi:hypothetical protein
VPLVLLVMPVLFRLLAGRWRSHNAMLEAGATPESEQRRRKRDFGREQRYLSNKRAGYSIERIVLVRTKQAPPFEQHCCGGS